MSPSVSEGRAGVAGRGQNWPGPVGDSGSGAERATLDFGPWQSGVSAGVFPHGPVTGDSVLGTSDRAPALGFSDLAVLPSRGEDAVPHGLRGRGPQKQRAVTVHDPVHMPVPPSDSQAGTPWACSGDTKKPRSSYRGDSGVQDTRASPAHLGPTALPAGLGDVGSGSWLADGGHSASEAKSRGFWGGGWGAGRPTKAPLVTVAHPRQGSPERGGSLVDPQTAGAGHQVPAPSDLWQG